jgi:hypothetical protein
MKRVSDADLRLLRIFATVADSKGFSGAQAALNLSLSSISGYVTALERRGPSRAPILQRASGAGCAPHP